MNSDERVRLDVSCFLKMSSFAIITLTKRELVAFLSMSSGCHVVVFIFASSFAMDLSALCDCGICW